MLLLYVHLFLADSWLESPSRQSFRLFPFLSDPTGILSILLFNELENRRIVHLLG